MSFLDAIHGQHIAKRRAKVLSEHLTNFVPDHARVLDVGCGDGEIAWILGQKRSDLEISGVDVLVRPDTLIPVQEYDGENLPFDDNSFDVVTLIDVVHHCYNPLVTIREASRVASTAVIIKDHLCDGFAAGTTLRFMDWVGNHRYGVALPYSYLSEIEWQRAFEILDLEVDDITKRLHLYPLPASIMFDRSLHFMARLVHQETENLGEHFEQTEFVHAGV